MIFFVHAKCFLLKYMAGLNFTQKIFIVRIIGEEEDIQVKGMLDDDLFIYLGVHFQGKQLCQCLFYRSLN